MPIIKPIEMVGNREYDYTQQREITSFAGRKGGKIRRERGIEGPGHAEKKHL